MTIRARNKHIRITEKDRRNPPRHPSFLSVLVGNNKIDLSPEPALGASLEGVPGDVVKDNVSGVPEFRVEVIECSNQGNVSVIIL